VCDVGLLDGQFGVGEEPVIPPYLEHFVGKAGVLDWADDEGR
jgi:hypothetical protein